MLYLLAAIVAVAFVYLAFLIHQRDRRLAELSQALVDEQERWRQLTERRENRHFAAIERAHVEHRNERQLLLARETNPELADGAAVATMMTEDPELAYVAPDDDSGFWAEQNRLTGNGDS